MKVSKYWQNFILILEHCTNYKLSLSLFWSKNTTLSLNQQMTSQAKIKVWTSQSSIRFLWTMITSGPVVSCLIYARSVEAVSGSLLTDGCSPLMTQETLKWRYQLKHCIWCLNFVPKKEESRLFSGWVVLSLTQIVLNYSFGWLTLTWDTEIHVAHTYSRGNTRIC